MANLYQFGSEPNLSLGSGARVLPTHSRPVVLVGQLVLGHMLIGAIAASFMTAPIFRRMCARGRGGVTRRDMDVAAA